MSEACAAGARGRLVTVYGETRPTAGAALRAPVSERDCVWWSLVIRPLRRVGLRRGVPSLPRIRQSEDPFALVDGAAAVRVDAAGITTYDHPPDAVVREAQPTVLGGGPVLARVTRRLAARIPELRETLSGGGYRRIDSTERHLAPGRRVAVSGELHDDPSSGGVVLRAHRPGRTPLFAITPGQDHTDVADLRRQCAGALLVGGVLVAVGLAAFLAGLPALLRDLAAIADGIAGAGARAE